MDKGVIVLSASNVELGSLKNTNEEKSLSTESSEENLANGTATTSTNGNEITHVSKTIINGNQPLANGKSTPRHSNGFNACKTEWVRLNIGKTNFICISD